MSPIPPSNLQTATDPKRADVLAAELETEGLVVLHGLLSAEQLSAMQRAFAARLGRMRWNNADGYHQTERFRHMVEDVLVLDQAFVDLALHPLVVRILDRYLGPSYHLTEAKGWRSVPTERDFHGWHGDAWYDQAVAPRHSPGNQAGFLSHGRRQRRFQLCNRQPPEAASPRRQQ